MARELTTAEVDSMVEALGNAASIAKEGQFDGVELHGHEGYLMDQFTTALWNRRTDKYGGDLMGRMNFVLSIIKAIQEKAGSDFPIVYRYGPDHKIENGRSLQEGIEMAEILEKVFLEHRNIARAKLLIKYPDISEKGLQKKVEKYSINLQPPPRK